MLLGGGAAALLGQNASAAALAAENETLNNTCAAGHNCGTLASAVKDTGRAAWNTALGAVQSVPNLVSGALPGYPDYVPFLSSYMLPYDDPDFGSLVSFAGALGVGALVSGTAKSAATEAATNNAVAGSVADANFAQSAINAAGTFSAAGAAKYSQLAGVPINTIDDLAGAIASGLIRPSQLPVDYVVSSNGTQLILNTRTSVALSQAGIPQSEWYGVNQTGVQVPGMPTGTTFNDLAAAQLARNKLSPTGTSTVPRGSK